MASTLGRLSDAPATCLTCSGRLFVRHFSLRTAEVTDVFPGVFTP